MNYLKMAKQVDKIPYGNLVHTTIYGWRFGWMFSLIMRKEEAVLALLFLHEMEKQG